MDNILIDELDSRVSLISGSPKPLSMMEGIDSSFDGGVFLWDIMLGPAVPKR